MKVPNRIKHNGFIYVKAASPQFRLLSFSDYHYIYNKALKLRKTNADKRIFEVSPEDYGFTFDRDDGALLMYYGLVYTVGNKPTAKMIRQYLTAKLPKVWLRPGDSRGSKQSPETEPAGYWHAPRLFNSETGYTYFGKGSVTVHFWNKSGNKALAEEEIASKNLGQIMISFNRKNLVDAKKLAKVLMGKYSFAKINLHQMD